MMAVLFSPPLACSSKYFSKTAAKQFLFNMATLAASSSAREEMMGLIGVNLAARIDLQQVVRGIAAVIRIDGVKYTYS